MPLSEAELRQLAALAGDVTAIFSWKSPSARALDIAPEKADPERLFALMVAEPRLIKRPLITRGEQIAAGSDPAGLARLFGAE